MSQMDDPLEEFAPKGKEIGTTRCPFCKTPLNKTRIGVHNHLRAHRRRGDLGDISNKHFHTLIEEISGIPFQGGKSRKKKRKK